MAIRDIFKVNFKTFVNPTAWLGWEFIKTQTLLVIAMFRAVFFPTPPTGIQETFEDAQKRFELKDEEVENIGRNYFLLALLYLFLGLLLLILTFYFLFTGAFAGFFLALAVTAYLLSQAFQNHFWYFQIKNRKLGLTYEEWRHGKPKIKGPSND